MRPACSLYPVHFLVPIRSTLFLLGESWYCLLSPFYPPPYCLMDLVCWYEKSCLFLYSVHILLLLLRKLKVDVWRRSIIKGGFTPGSTGADVASLFCWISAVLSQDNSPPSLRKQSSSLGLMLSPKQGPQNGVWDPSVLDPDLNENPPLVSWDVKYIYW